MGSRFASIALNVCAQHTAKQPAVFNRQADNLCHLCMHLSILRAGTAKLQVSLAVAVQSHLHLAFAGYTTPRDPFY